MTSLEMHADLMNYLYAAAAATVTGVALNVACTIGHRENQRGKKDKSMRSQRGKKNGSQRSLRSKKKGNSQRSLRNKKKGPVAPAPAGVPAVPPSKEPVKSKEPQEKSARSKASDKDKSSRSKKPDGDKSNRGKKDASKKSKKSSKTKKAKESSKRDKKPETPKEAPKEAEKDPATAVLAPTPEALVPPADEAPPTTPPTTPPAPAAAPVVEPPKEVIETNNGIVTPDRPESVMVDLCGGPGAGNPADKSHRIYGTAGEAAAAEAKRQAELDRMKPKEQLDPGQSQYMK